MRYLFVMILLVSQPVWAGVPAEDAKRVEDFTKKMKSLDNTCTADSDCFATGRYNAVCMTMCGGCGIVLSKKAQGALKLLEEEMKPLQGRHCEMGKCAPGYACVVHCVDGACQGKTEQH